MSPQDVLDKLFPPLTKERKDKVLGLCQRAKVDVNAVLALMSDYQREQWEKL